LIGKGDRVVARPVLEQALQSARAIVMEANRDMNVRWISRAIADLDKPAK
jgi:hypothetical protein